MAGVVGFPAAYGGYCCLVTGELIGVRELNLRLGEARDIRRRKEAVLPAGNLFLGIDFELILM